MGSLTRSKGTVCIPCLSCLRTLRRCRLRAIDARRTRGWAVCHANPSVQNSPYFLRKNGINSSANRCRLSIVGKWRRSAAASWSGDLDMDPVSGTSYKYDSTEIKELQDLMPDPLEATLKPTSKEQLKSILEKYNLSTVFIFEDDPLIFGDDPIFEPIFEVDGEVYDESEDGDDDSGARLFPHMDLFEEALIVDSVTEGYKFRKQWELDRVFDKAMELHHSQNTRSINIYATTMWFSKILQHVEMQDNYEGGEPCPIPAWVRSIFILEEHFDELNEKQNEVDRLAGERSKEQEDAAFYNWVEENIDIPVEIVRQQELEADEPLAIEEDSSEKDRGDELDTLLEGIIPNSGEETIDESNVTDDYMAQLMEGDIEFQERDELSLKLPGFEEGPKEE